MTFKEFYISDKSGKSNCVIRSLCKILNKKYDDVCSDLCLVTEKLKCDSFNDILVFEKYMEENNIFKIKALFHFMRDNYILYIHQKSQCLKYYRKYYSR